MVSRYEASRFIELRGHMAEQSAVGLLIGYLLVIGIMLGGMAMIVGGPSLTGRLYRWMFRHMVREPLRWVWRNWVIPFFRWAGRHIRAWLAQFFRWMGRQIWRGVRYTWVRLTT